MHSMTQNLVCSNYLSLLNVLIKTKHHQHLLKTLYHANEGLINKVLSVIRKSVILSEEKLLPY